MSEVRELVLNASRVLFEEHCTPKVLAHAEKGGYPTELWRALEETGMPWVLVPESLGGAGLSVPDAGALIRQAAYYAAPVPLCETALVTWLLGEAEMEIPEGALSAGFVMANDGACELLPTEAGWKIRGRVPRIPWAGRVSTVVLVIEAGADALLAVLPSGVYRLTQGMNLAAEPRDTIDLDLQLPNKAVARIPVGFSTVYEMGAALRTAQISGALQRALEISVAYTMERKQFGRPLAKFQSVQNNLAILASQVAAANGAAELALGVAGEARATVAIAAAKARASEAATIGAAIAHQVHGAMGLTDEYALHHLTQRLWSWRDEFGGETYWWGRLGEIVLTNGADHYWQTVCGVDDLLAGRG